MNENLKRVLDLSDQLRVRITAECKISRATLLNWAHGRTPIPFWAEERINKVTKELMGEEIFIEENK